MYPTHSHSTLPRHTVALVHSCFESYAAGDPVTAVEWFQLPEVPTERKEIANTMNNYLISSHPQICIYVCICGGYFFLMGTLLLICSYCPPYRPEQDRIELNVQPRAR